MNMSQVYCETITVCKKNNSSLAILDTIIYVKKQRLDYTDPVCFW